MAKNSTQDGRIMTLTAPSGGVVSGTMYLIGALLVVAQISADAGSLFTGDTKGVHELPKTTGQAWTEGQILYWDDTTKKLTSTAGSNEVAGCAAAAAGSSATTGFCRLNGTVA